MMFEVPIDSTNELPIVYPPKRDDSWKRSIVCGGCDQEIKYGFNDLILVPKAERVAKAYNGKHSIWNIKGEHVCLVCRKNGCNYVNEIDGCCFKNTLRVKIVDNIVGRVVRDGVWENRFLKDNELICYKKSDVVYDRNGGNLNIDTNDGGIMNFDVNDYLNRYDRWSNLCISIDRKYISIDRRECCIIS